MLAVVQHDQRLPRLQRVSQRVPQRAPGLAVHPDQGGHPGHDQVRLPQVAQFDHVHPVGEVPGHGGQQPQGQPGLPDPARAAQGEGPGPAQRVTQVAEFALPPDEPVWLLGQLSRPCFWFQCFCGSGASGSIFPFNSVARLPSVFHHSVRPAPGIGPGRP